MSVGFPEPVGEGADRPERHEEDRHRAQAEEAEAADLELGMGFEVVPEERGHDGQDDADHGQAEEHEHGSPPLPAF